jgi:hypothetical protein
MTNRWWTAAILAAACGVIGGCTTREIPQADVVGGKLKAVREEILRVVPDARRQAQLRQAVDRMERELDDFDRAISALSTASRALNADPDASRAQFQELVDRFESRSRPIRERVTRVHFDLLALATADEWKSIARHERDALEAAGQIK